MSETSIIQSNEGTLVSFSFNWPDGAGGNADLTGYTVDAYQVDSVFSGFVTVSLSDAANGLISASVAWDESFIDAADGKGFRVRITTGGVATTTNKIKLNYT